MSRQIRTLVVGVAALDDQDPRPGGTDADPVMAPAARLAAALGAALHVVHAYESPAVAPGANPAPGGWAADRVRAAVEARLAAQVAALAPRAAIRCHAAEGPTAPTLVRLAGALKADLLVVGASRRGQAWRGILGSTASQVLAESPVPVLVMTRPLASPVRRVLLTAELGGDAEAALRRGLDAAASLAAGAAPEVRCLHVVESDPLVPAPCDPAVLESFAAGRLAEMLSRLPGAVSSRVRTGDPAREIAREAGEWEADLLVLATHAHPERTGHVLGRVAFAAIRGSPCPVLAIPADAPCPSGAGTHAGEDVAALLAL